MILALTGGRVQLPERSPSGRLGWTGVGLQESADRRTPGGCAAWKQVLTLRAQVAVIHSTLVSAYYMLCRDQPYRDLGPDRLRRYDDEAHARRLIAQLEG